MASIIMKEIIKSKIKRLEAQKRADFDLIQKLNQEILLIQEKVDHAFENSGYKNQLEDQLAL